MGAVEINNIRFDDMWLEYTLVNKNLSAIPLFHASWSGYKNSLDYPVLELYPPIIDRFILLVNNPRTHHLIGLGNDGNTVNIHRLDKDDTVIFRIIQKVGNQYDNWWSTLTPGNMEELRKQLIFLKKKVVELIDRHSEGSE